MSNEPASFNFGFKLPNNGSAHGTIEPQKLALSEVDSSIVLNNIKSFKGNSIIQLGP